MKTDSNGKKFQCKECRRDPDFHDPDFHVWDVKREPPPVANAPPIDLFPAYDEQPGPSADNYLRDPEYPAEAYF